MERRGELTPAEERSLIFHVAKLPAPLESKNVFSSREIGSITWPSRVRNVNAEKQLVISSPLLCKSDQQPLGILIVVQNKENQDVVCSLGPWRRRRGRSHDHIRARLEIIIMASQHASDS